MIELKEVVGHRALIEPVEGYLRAVGRPPHRGGLIEFLSIQPAARAVLGPGLLIAVGCDRHFAGAACVAPPEIAIAIECLELLIR